MGGLHGGHGGDVADAAAAAGRRGVGMRNPGPLIGRHGLTTTLWCTSTCHVHDVIVLYRHTINSQLYTVSVIYSQLYSVDRSQEPPGLRSPALGCGKTIVAALAMLAVRRFGGWDVLSSTAHVGDKI